MKIREKRERKMMENENEENDERRMKDEQKFKD